MNILICNDDGIFSEGLKTLARFLSKENSVYVMAPDGNRSAYSHSMSFYKKLVLKKVEQSENYVAYSLSGTPADCVRFGVEFFKDVKFDLVVSGVNNGSNAGTDTLYSGTVSACFEACILKIPSIAFSVVCDKEILDYTLLNEQLSDVFPFLLKHFSKDYVFNVNFPDKLHKGVKICKLGVQLYSDRYIKNDDGSFMLVGDLLKNDKNDEDCDVEWLRKDYITITPLITDRTAYNVLKVLSKEVM